MKIARSMLTSAKLDRCFWEEMIGTTCCFISRSPCLALTDKIPYEVWIGRNLSVAHLRVFGCEAFIHVP